MFGLLPIIILILSLDKSQSTSVLDCKPTASSTVLMDCTFNEQGWKNQSERCIIPSNICAETQFVKIKDVLHPGMDLDVSGCGQLMKIEFLITAVDSVICERIITRQSQVVMIFMARAHSCVLVSIVSYMYQPAHQACVLALYFSAIVSAHYLECQLESLIPRSNDIKFWCSNML